MARKRRVPKERVLNCMSTGEIARWFAERRSNASPPKRARKILNKASNRTALAPKHGGLWASVGCVCNGIGEGCSRTWNQHAGASVSKSGTNRLQAIWKTSCVLRTRFLGDEYRTTAHRVWTLEPGSRVRDTARISAAFHDVQKRKCLDHDRESTRIERLLCFTGY